MDKKQHWNLSNDDQDQANPEPICEQKYSIIYLFILYHVTFALSYDASIEKKVVSLYMEDNKINQSIKSVTSWWDQE